MKVKSIRKIPKEVTYDLNIKDNHNYFVSNSDVLVHNSGKDPSKVDRSAAYMARYIAKNIVASKICTSATVQLAYAIGVVEPVSVMVQAKNCKYEGEVLTAAVRKTFRLTPRGIIESLDLKRPIYQETAAYGHFGRELPNFTWEKTDKVQEILKYLGEI